MIYYSVSSRRQFCVVNRDKSIK